MMRSYRNSFIRAYTVSIGILLTLVFVAVGAMIHQADYQELKTTMQHVLTQVQKQERSLPDDEKPPAKPPENKPDNKPDAKPDDARTPDKPLDRSGKEPETLPLPVDADSILTLIVDRDSMEITLTSELPEEIDADVVSAAAQQIVQQTESYGRLRDYRLIYMREPAHDKHRIAIASADYVGKRDAVRISLLAALYLSALLAAFLLSRKLSFRAAKPLEQAVQMERQFVTDISHDLKTPITVILANQNILRGDPDAKVSDMAQWINSTDDAAKNMMSLVQKMLTLSELDSVTQHVTPESVDLSMTAEKCILQMESIAYDRSVTLQSSIEPHVFARATTDYAERICTGLLENALKYEPNGGAVEVRVYSEHRKVILSVCNRGSLIDPEDLPHIFERFYRGDKTRNLRSGHGLGLPILYKIAELVGAQMDVRSSADEGTVFTVRFMPDDIRS